MLIRKRMRFYGSVQGVGFRYYARNAAAFLGMTGFAYNESDGTVLMEIQGPEECFPLLLPMLERGSFIRIESVEQRRIPVMEGEYDFRTD